MWCCDPAVDYLGFRIRVGAYGAGVSPSCRRPSHFSGTAQKSNPKRPPRSRARCAGRPAGPRDHEPADRRVSIFASVKGLAPKDSRTGFAPTRAGWRGLVGANPVRESFEARRHRASCPRQRAFQTMRAAPTPRKPHPRRRPVNSSANATSPRTAPNTHTAHQPPICHAMATPPDPSAPPMNMPLMNTVLSRLRASGRRA
jgi:hypothetical protein